MALVREQGLGPEREQGRALAPAPVGLAPGQELALEQVARVELVEVGND